MPQQVTHAFAMSVGPTPGHYVRACVAPGVNVKGAVLRLGSIATRSLGRGRVRRRSSSESEGEGTATNSISAARQGIKELEP
jgi:hypothetical protein